MQISRTLSDNDIDSIRDDDVSSAKYLAELYNVSKRVIYRVRKREIIKRSEKFNQQDIADILDTNSNLAQKVQKAQDKNRIANKSFREHSRYINAIEHLNEELIKTLKTKQFSTLQHNTSTNDKPIGVIQLSDIHFNEQIDMPNNKYNFEVAAGRLKKLVEHAKSLFKANGVEHVLIALTGDLLNSDRRLDEILNNAKNRTDALFLATDIIQQIIQDVNQDFNVSVASITGNESRVREDLSFSKFVASDSFDIMIHNLLAVLFKDTEGVTILPVDHCLEQVINLNGTNLMLIHGHNGVANTSKAETKVAEIKAKYSTRGIFIDYVIFGHIHCQKLDTLVSTPKGFIQLKDIKIGDTVYGYEDGKVVESLVTNTISGLHTGNMYQFKNNTCTQFVTDGHYMSLKNGEYLSAKEYISQNRLIDTVEICDPLDAIEQDYSISDDMLRMLVAVCADGSFSKKMLRFHFKKQRKIDRLNMLCKKLGKNVEWGIKSKNDSYKTKTFGKEFVMKISEYVPQDNKILPDFFYKLSTRQAKVVVDELHHWDGNKSKLNSYQFTSCKPKEIDIVCHLLIKIGVLGLVCGSRNNCVNYSMKPNPYRNTNVKYDIIPVENLPVGCLTTTSKNFFIRTEHGRVELSGNSAYISENYARSGGLCGGNEYSDMALNKDSRASQNIYLVNANRNGVHGMKVDLQSYEGYQPYNFDRGLECYASQNNKHKVGGTVIHQIVI